jgi:murein DD-endopeptidase MepM/ murein hydrolase activator NlpD
MIHSQQFKPIVVVVAAGLALGAVTALAVAPRSASEFSDERSVVESLDLPRAAAPEPLDRFLQAERVRRGDSLASLMARLGALDIDFQRFVATDRAARKVLGLAPGRTVLAELDGAGIVRRFSYRLDGIEDADNGSVRPGRRVLIMRDPKGRLSAREEFAPIERDTEVRSVVIHDGIRAAAEGAGIPDAVLTQIDDLFGNEFDIFRDFRGGDRIKVAWETVREAGSFDTPAAGRVLAVELESAGLQREAYWFARPGARGRGEYLAADGRSLRKDYLRNPVEISRVKSSFSEARLHPILGEWRAHKGVDLAAPLGTRVRSVGDGKVTFLGEQRGYGNVIFIRHARSVSTVYAHLNEFAHGLRAGDSVGKGDVIGYVGQTGWATGPHLHYEFLINGAQTDPMSIALLQAPASLDAADKRRFNDVVATRRAELGRADGLAIARFQ